MSFPINLALKMRIYITKYNMYITKHMIILNLQFVIIEIKLCKHFKFSKIGLSFLLKIKMSFLISVPYTLDSLV